MNKQTNLFIVLLATSMAASASFVSTVPVQLKTSREILSCKASTEQAKDLIDQCLIGEKDTKNYILTLTISTDKGINVITQCNEKKVHMFIAGTEIFVNDSDAVRQLTEHPDLKNRSISYTLQQEFQKDLVAKKVTIDCKSSNASYGFIVNLLKKLDLHLDKTKI